ncbi:MAG: trimeric intracellular cation channel family protein [Mangrovicoccus sp.]
MQNLPIPLIVDLTGTFVFGLSGAMLAVRRKLDIFGVVVLALATALAGGAIRDVLLGAQPPATLQDGRFLAAALGSALVAFLAHPVIERLNRPVMILDAIGLGVFAVSGCSKALAYDLGPGAAMLLGVISGVGGGALRDILVAETPRVLHEELYAVAALVGAGLVALGSVMGWQADLIALSAVSLTFVIRVLSVRFNISAPRAPWS